MLPINRLLKNYRRNFASFNPLDFSARSSIAIVVANNNAPRRMVFFTIRGLGQWKSRIALLQYWGPNMPSTKPKTQTKSATVIALLNRGRGASVDELCKSTNWKQHSVRAFLTGLRKKGFVIEREQHDDKGNCYRITQKPATSRTQGS